MERTQDIVTGLAMAGLGLAAATIATGYSGASGYYPLALGGVLAILGSGIALRAMLLGKDDTRPLADGPARLAATIVLMAAYLALVPVLGFFTASTLITLVLPVALGLRRPILLGATTVVFIATVYALFTFVLARPLPAEFWQAG